jgi:isopropylmalate/homocitrate/citramalate synthase
VVTSVARRLLDLGCYEVSLGETIGTATPGRVRTMLAAVMEAVPRETLAVHLHDTYGQALANLMAALELGIAVADSSVAGLGGCPYAKGAAGNVASEDVLYLLNGLGIRTGVELEKLAAVGRFISAELGREPASKVARALAAKAAA